jgi:hypothetical protein
MLSRLTVLTFVTIMIAFALPTTLPALCQTSKPSDDEFSQRPVKWLIGRELDQNNQLAIAASWTDAPLRERLAAFSRQQRTGIFLDRRVDPSQLINITIARQTPEQFLWQIAEKCDLGICRIENFYYLGPAETAESFPHLWSAMKKASSKFRRSSTVRWTDRQPVQYTSIVQPKQLLNELAEQYEFSITNPDELPHDVWSAFELPEMTLDLRIAILLVGFDKWYERSEDGKKLTIVDFPEVEVGRTEIRDLVDAKKLSTEMKAKFPELRFSTSRTTIKAVGPPSQLAQLQRMLVMNQKAVVNNNDLAPLTLTTTASRKAILMKIAEVKGKKFAFQSGTQQALSEQVSVSVKNASVHELIKQVLKGSDLKYELNEIQLKIFK